MSDHAELERLARLAKAASLGGDWTSDLFGHDRLHGIVEDELGSRIALTTLPAYAGFFAAASPDVVLAMLDENRRLRSALEPFAKAFDEGNRLPVPSNGGRAKTMRDHVGSYHFEQASIALTETPPSADEPRSGSATPDGQSSPRKEP